MEFEDGFNVIISRYAVRKVQNSRLHMSEELSNAANREDELRRCRQAAVEITTALAGLTLRDLSPRLQAKFGIDAQLLGLAIAQAGIRVPQR